MSQLSTASAPPKPFTSADERDRAFRDPRYAPERPNGSGPNPKHDPAFRKETLERHAATLASGRKLD